MFTSCDMTDFRFSRLEFDSKMMSYNDGEHIKLCVCSPCYRTPRREPISIIGSRFLSETPILTPYFAKVTSGVFSCKKPHLWKSWWFMKIHDDSWKFMMNHDSSWCIMMQHDASWCIMMRQGASWCFSHRFACFRMFLASVWDIYLGCIEQGGVRYKYNAISVRDVAGI